MSSSGDAVSSPVDPALASTPPLLLRLAAADVPGGAGQMRDDDSEWDDARWTSSSSGSHLSTAVSVAPSILSHLSVTQSIRQALPNGAAAAWTAPMMCSNAWFSFARPRPNAPLKNRPTPTMEAAVLAVA